MRTDTFFSIIYFALFTVFYLIGISKFFVIVYLIFGIVGFIYFDNYEKKKRRK